MARKKDNDMVLSAVTAALNASFVHGMTMQRLQDAELAAQQTGATLQHLIGQMNEVLHTPDKKDMN